jgi:hypothetical protein
VGRKRGATSSTIVDDKDYEIHVISLPILKKKILGKTTIEGKRCWKRR